VTEKAEAEEDTAEEKVCRILDQEPFYDDRVDILINVLMSEVCGICTMTEDDETKLIEELRSVIDRWELKKLPMEPRQLKDVN
jgi:hypothetical protein